MRHLSRLDPAKPPRRVGLDGRRQDSSVSAARPRSGSSDHVGLGSARGSPDRRHVVSLALGIVGLLIATYLAAFRLNPDEVTLYCSVTGPLNCEQVTTSPQGMLAGVPTPVWGTGWFIAWLGLVAVSMRRRSAALRRARLVWATGALGFVGYLIYSELFVIGAICEWCTATHIVVFALFGLTLSEELEARRRRAEAAAPR